MLSYFIGFLVFLFFVLFWVFFISLMLCLYLLNVAVCFLTFLLGLAGHGLFVISYNVEGSRGELGRKRIG